MDGTIALIIQLNSFQMTSLVNELNIKVVKSSKFRNEKEPNHLKLGPVVSKVVVI